METSSRPAATVRIAWRRKMTRSSAFGLVSPQAEAQQYGQSFIEGSTHPSTTTPIPENPDDCKKWKMMLGIGWTVSELSITTLAVEFVMKKMRSRPRAERILSENHPYRPIVKNIDNDEPNNPVDETTENTKSRS